MEDSKKYETPEAQEALIDGLSLICQRLNEFYDGKKTSIMPISQPASQSQGRAPFKSLKPSSRKLFEVDIGNVRWSVQKNLSNKPA